MKNVEKIINLCTNELVFTTSRSGGPGGQNVNKVESKVTLKWDVVNSLVLTELEKSIVLIKLGNKITQDGIMILYHQKERSQLANKEMVVKKWSKLLLIAFKVIKKRKPTKPSFTSIIKIKKAKTIKSERKKTRKKPKIDY